MAPATTTDPLDEVLEKMTSRSRPTQPKKRQSSARVSLSLVNVFLLRPTKSPKQLASNETHFLCHSFQQKRKLPIERLDTTPLERARAVAAELRKANSWLTNLVFLISFYAILVVSYNIIFV